VRRWFYVFSVIGVIFIGLRIFLFVDQPSVPNWPPILLLLASTTLFVGALCSATLVLGMVLFWFRFDQHRSLWLLGILVSPLGAAAYCLSIYRDHKPPSTAT